MFTRQRVMFNEASFREVLLSRYPMTGEVSIET